MMSRPIDANAVRRHLDILSPVTPHIITAFPEAPGVEGGARQFRGSCSTLLGSVERAQRDGYGVFVAVNAFRGSRRRNEEITAARALWIERDELGPRLPLPPSVRIRTSPGKGHDYILLKPDALTPAEAERINRHIASTYGGDCNACDLSRVLRLAGTCHLKTETAHRVEIIGGNGQRYDRRAILDAFPLPREPERRVMRAPERQVVRRGDYIDATIKGVLNDLLMARQGQRNRQLNLCAIRLAQVGLSFDAALGLLSPVAADIGLKPHEITATIRSGHRFGTANPRGRAA